MAEGHHSLGDSCQFRCADPDGILIVSVIFSTLLTMQARRHEHVACAHFDLVCLAWAAATLCHNEMPTSGR